MLLFVRAPTCFSCFYFVLFVSFWIPLVSPRATLTYQLPTLLCHTNGPRRTGGPPPGVAAGAYAAAIPAADATPLAIDLSSERSNYCSFGSRFPCYSSSPHSWFDNGTHKRERRCNVWSADVLSRGQLHDVCSCGSVWTEPGNTLKCCLPRGFFKEEAPL